MNLLYYLNINAYLNCIKYNIKLYIERMKQSERDFKELTPVIWGTDKFSVQGRPAGWLETQGRVAVAA